METSMTFQFGLERLLTDSDRLATLKSARVGLVAHPCVGDPRPNPCA